MNLVEDYCSYELAKLLKEKGFDEPVETVIYPNGEWAFIDTRSVSRTLHTMLRNSELNIYDDCVSMPTHQLAYKWMREVHKLSVEIASTESGRWMALAYELGETRSFVEAYISTYDTHEEATEAAIKYCLENLI